MSIDQPTTEIENTALTAEIVAAYLKRNQIAADQLVPLISTLHAALVDLSASPETAEIERTPAVPIRRSVQRHFVICLDCGFRGRTLRRHLRSRHGLTVEDYRRRWKLAHDHRVTAPAYSEHRSGMAKKAGLGNRRKTATVKPSKPASQETAATARRRKRPGSKRSLTKHPNRSP